RVRRAMLMAIDRKGLIEKVLGGQGTVVNSSFYGDIASAAAEDYPHDPARAKSLLAEAGWDGSEPVTLSWIPGQRDRDTAVTVVQSQLKAVGVDVKLKQVQARSEERRVGREGRWRRTAWEERKKERKQRIALC